MTNRNKRIVTRFAPSPTGALHVGGARTALFNWAFARHFGGEFILRIEDTDKARSTENNTHGLIRDLNWLRLDWDQGPGQINVATNTGGQATSGTRLSNARPTIYENQIGDNGPYFQSQRDDIYKGYLEKLQSKGLIYDDRGALRFKMPKRNITINDLILGAVTLEHDQPQMQDFIIYKSDKAGGGPTFHFANIIDDATMGITHVIRGQEHLNNTVKHIALAEALELEAPDYAHIPLIFNPDGSKMSKRDKAKTAREGIKKAIENGQDKNDLIDKIIEISQDKIHRSSFEEFIEGENDDAEIAKWFAFELKLDLPEIDVDDFKESGYLPSVLINYLSLLGWNPGNDIEDFGANPLEFLKENFSLDRVQKAAAKFDRQKLLHFNGERIAKLSEEDFKKKLIEKYDTAILNGLYENIGGKDKFSLFAKAYHQRAKTLNDPLEQGEFFVKPLKDDDYDLTVKPVRKMLKNQEQVEKTLKELEQRFNNISDKHWKEEIIEKQLEDYATENELKMGKAAQPIRVAVSGGAVSPPIGITLEILGKEKTLERIDLFASVLAHQQDA